MPSERGEGMNEEEVNNRLDICRGDLWRLGKTRREVGISPRVWLSDDRAEN